MSSAISAIRRVNSAALQAFAVATVGSATITVLLWRELADLLAEREQRLHRGIVLDDGKTAHGEGSFRRGGRNGRRFSARTRRAADP